MSGHRNRTDSWMVVVTILLVLIAAVLTQSAKADQSGTISISPNTWFGKTVEQAGTYLTSNGYRADPENTTGLFRNVAWKFTSRTAEPHQVDVWFVSETRVVSHVAFCYSKSSESYSRMRDSLSLLYGDPVHTEQRTETQQRYTITYAESEYWTDGSVRYTITSADKSDGSIGTLTDVRNGRTDYVLTIRRVEQTNTSASRPTASPRPTATPRPVQVEVAIDSVEIRQNRYGGSEELYVRFKNNASRGVDRVDFYVECYNTYGEKILQYGRTETLITAFYDELISPGRTSDRNHYWTLYGYEGVARVRIAIYRYHRVDGVTVTVPDTQLRWRSFNR